MTDSRTKHTGFWYSSPSGGLQKLGIIASIILSVLAVLLTVKYGESKDQINQLVILSQQQVKEIRRLDSIYGEDKHQTKNSDSSLNQIKQSNDKLVKQTKLLSDAVTILTTDQIKASKLQGLSDRASYMQLKFANERLFDINNPIVLEGLNNPKPNKITRTECMNHLKSILETQLSNTYLLEHKRAADHWADAWLYCEATLLFENTNFLTNQYSFREGTKYTIPDSPSEVEKMHIQMFEELLKLVGKLHWEILKQGAWKKGETKIF